MELSVDLERTLRKYWGYSNFRNQQRELCCAILDGKDVFTSMATGSGKSLIYQLPAVACRDIGILATIIVVSPLISLMNDQVLSLVSLGIQACSLGTNASTSTEMMASNGHFAVVYATPEKLLGWESGLKKMMRNSKLICLAIDESHCVSDWGHDFRPQYRQLVDLRQIIGYDVPVVALTASATAQVQSDIINTLRLRDPIIVKMPLNRTNLKYFVVHKNGPNDVVTLLWRFRREQLAECGVDKTAGKSIPFHATLVYVNSKREANEISTLLSRCKSIEGLGVAAYHADLPTEEREIAHAMFLMDKVQVMVATVAYGMGINKPNIRQVIHYGMPMSLESYCQQTGRAGRDGQLARCVLLYSRQDVVKCFNIATMSTNSFSLQLSDYQSAVNSEQHSLAISRHDEMRRLNHHLFHMSQYSKGVGNCRRKYLLEYFGEALLAGYNSSAKDCTNCCDICDEYIAKKGSAAPSSWYSNATQSNNSDRSDGEEVVGEKDEEVSIDVGYEICMLLCTIIDCGERFGSGIPISILLGRHDSSVKRVDGYEEFEFFGMGSIHSLAWWKGFLVELVDHIGMVAAVLTKSGFSNFGYEKFVVTEKGRQFLSLSGNDHHHEDLATNNGTGNISSHSKSRYNRRIHKHSIVPQSKEFVQQVSDQVAKEKTACCSLSNKAIANLQVNSSSGNLATGLLFPNTKRKLVPKHDEEQDNSCRPSTPQRAVSIPIDQSSSSSSSSSSSRDNNSGMKRSLSSPIAYRENKITIKNESDQSSLSQKVTLTLAERFQLQLALRETRSTLSLQTGMKPYDVLSTEAVHALSELLPTSVHELIDVAGWGDWKIQTFGQAFCVTIANFLSTCGKLPLVADVDRTEGSVESGMAPAVAAQQGDYLEQDRETWNKYMNLTSVSLYRPDYYKKKEDYQVQNDDAPEPVESSIRAVPPPYSVSSVAPQSTPVSTTASNTAARGSKDPGQRTMKKKLDFMAQLKSSMMRTKSIG